jgi:hypothetical protein
MRKIHALAVLAALLAGCKAEMMEKRGDAMALFPSPTERPGRGGIIRYNNHGAQSWRDARRKDALKQMETFCQGDYTIVAEGPRSQFKLVSGIGFDPLDPNRYIEFDCAKPAEPTLFKKFPISIPSSSR